MRYIINKHNVIGLFVPYSKLEDVNNTLAVTQHYVLKLSRSLILIL